MLSDIIGILILIIIAATIKGLKLKIKDKFSFK